MDANLVTEQTLGFSAECLDRHGDEGRTHLLARGGKGVELTSIGRVPDLVRQPEKPVRFAGHGADDQDDLVALGLGLDRAFRDVAHPLEGADRSSAVLLND